MFLLKHCIEDLDAKFLKNLDEHILKLSPGNALTLKDGGAWVLVIGKSPGTCQIFALISAEVKLEPARREHEPGVLGITVS